MLIMAPLQLSGTGSSGSEDVSGAEQMLGSAETLARNLGDVQTRNAVKRVGGLLPCVSSVQLRSLYEVLQYPNLIA